MRYLKGIVLAGGAGTRLYPVTKAISKQLLPIYDKPMIYYPISTLMLAGIREILIISTPADINKFSDLLGDGSALGCSFSYLVQSAPRGLADAFLISEKFIDDDPVALALGDNIFFGSGFSGVLRQATNNVIGATIFGKAVPDPERFGVATIDEHGSVISLKEKPITSVSNLAVTGLYFYDNRVVEFAKSLKPSSRGELEITDLNNCYLQEQKLNLLTLPRGVTWLDTGTHESMMNASQFIYAIERTSGMKVGCLEEIAYESGWINDVELEACARALGNNTYGNYVQSLREYK